MRTVSASGNNITHCLSAARKLLGLKYRESMGVLVSGGQDGLWRVTLSTGDIVECTVRPGTVASAQLVCGCREIDPDYVRDFEPNK